MFSFHSSVYFSPVQNICYLLNVLILFLYFRYLRARLIGHFKQLFEHFKYTYTFFHLHVYQKHLNNITQIPLPNTPLVQNWKNSGVTLKTTTCLCGESWLVKECPHIDPPLPFHQPQLAYMVSCDWWKSVLTQTHHHLPTNHNLLHGQIVGKVVVLNVAPKFLLELSNLRLDFTKRPVNDKFVSCRSLKFQQ